MSENTENMQDTGALDGQGTEDVEGHAIQPPPVVDLMVEDDVEAHLWEPAPTGNIGADGTDFDRPR